MGIWGSGTVYLILLAQNKVSKLSPYSLATNIVKPDGAFSIQESYDVKMNESWDAFTPKVAVNYYIDENATAYATVATGVKSGGLPGP